MEWFQGQRVRRTSPTPCSLAIRDSLTGGGSQSPPGQAARLVIVCVCVCACVIVVRGKPTEAAAQLHKTSQQEDENVTIYGPRMPHPKTVRCPHPTPFSQLHKTSAVVSGGGDPTL